MREFCPPPLPKSEIAHLPNTVQVTEETLIDGEVHRSFIMKECDFTKIHEGLTPCDFSLSVLIANGAKDLLKECPSIKPSSLEVAEQVSNAINSIIHE